MCQLAKHLEMYLDGESLNFSYHVKEKIFKAMKVISIIRKLSKALPQYSFITISKSSLRPHLDYGDIIYDDPYKKKLKEFNIMLLFQLQKNLSEQVIQ